MVACRLQAGALTAAASRAAPAAAAALYSEQPYGRDGNAQGHANQVLSAGTLETGNKNLDTSWQHTPTSYKQKNTIRRMGATTIASIGHMMAALSHKRTVRSARSKGGTAAAVLKWCCVSVCSGNRQEPN
jgi:hypothetical protein